MKKMLSRISLGAGTLGLIVAGAAAFSAFEAHIINVTARIENALSVSTEALNFGTVFPQEYMTRDVTVSLSQSFLDEPRVEDIEYVIKQKPKVKEPCILLASDQEQSANQVVCTDDLNMNPVPGDPYAIINPTTFPDGIVAWKYCEENLPENAPYSLDEQALANEYFNYCYIPLADYLSKHSSLASDTSIDAFHHAYLWADGKSTLNPAYIATGHLTKLGATTTTWTIDLKVPCFINQCAQEADDEENDIDDEIPGFHVPADFRLPGALEHKVFGTDLWIEVTGVSLPPGGDQGNLTVTKIVINDGGGTKNVSDFPLFVDGSSVVSGVATTTNTGTHQVTETSDPNYTSLFGGDCNESGSVSVSTSTPAFCTITNTFVPTEPTEGTITVTKVVQGTSTPVSEFSLFVDGSPVTSGVATTTSLGAHIVSEGAAPGFTSAISGDCDAAGNVTLSTTTPSASCTITNTLEVAPTGTITVNKVVSDPGDISDQTADQFQMTIDGNPVAQGVPIEVTVGNHTVGEVDSKGDVVTFSVDCPGGVAAVVANTNTDCTVTNTVPFGTITVTKVVTNNNGGDKSVGDFNLFVASTSVLSAVAKNFAPGTYAVSESGLFGYAASFSGDCDATGNITIADGENASCIVNNDDIAPSVTVVKNVVGGTAAPDDFDVSIDGAVKTSGSSNTVLANSAHVIDEEATVTGYSFTSITGSSFLGVPCPADLEGTITLAPGDVVTCTITNTFAE